MILLSSPRKADSTDVVHCEDSFLPLVIEASKKVCTILYWRYLQAIMYFITKTLHFVGNSQYIYKTIILIFFFSSQFKTKERRALKFT